MPLLRCKWYDDNGNAITGGCHLQGSTCGFVHPSEPAWFRAPRKGPPADPRGAPPPRGGARGGARGRGSGSGRGGFQARAAPAASGWGTESTNWGGARATSSSGAAETTGSWGAQEAAAPVQEKKDAWSGWNSAGMWDAVGTASADLGKGKGKEKEASGWGSAAESGSGWGSGWGDEGGGAGGKSTGWGDQKTGTAESKPESKTNAQTSSGKTSEKAKEKEKWEAAYNGGWGSMGAPNGDGWGASTSWGTESGVDADGDATMQDQDQGREASKEEGEVREGGDAPMQDAPAEEADEGENEDHAWQLPAQTWDHFNNGLGDAPGDTSMDAQAPTRAGIQEPDPSTKSQADKESSAHTYPIAGSVSTMDADRKQREPSNSPFDSDAGRYAPDSLPGRREACRNQINAMAHAVELYMRLQKEEEELARCKRMQISKNYERVGRSGQEILNTKRKMFQERVALSRKDYDVHINKLAGYPSLESILMGFDPDMETRSALDYLGQIKEWTAAVQPSVQHIVDQEAKAQEEKRQRSPDEPDYIPASIRPIYQQLRNLEEQAAAMQAELEYRMDQTSDLVDQRLEERRPELVAAFAEAQLAAQDEALREPFDALNRRLSAVGAGIEEQANRFAPLMHNEAAQQDISHIKAEHEDLKAQVSQIEARTAQTHADMQAELARSRALRAQLDTAPSPHVARTLSADEMMHLLEPELRRLVRSDVARAAEIVELRYRAYIQQHQEALYGAVWTRLHPTMTLVDTARAWMDNMVGAVEDAEAKPALE